MQVGRFDLQPRKSVIIVTVLFLAMIRGFALFAKHQGAPPLGEVLMTPIIFSAGLLLTATLVWAASLPLAVRASRLPDFWMVVQLYLLTSVLMAPSAAFSAFQLSQGGEAFSFGRMEFLPFPFSLFPYDKWVQLIVFLVCSVLYARQLPTRTSAPVTA